MLICPLCGGSLDLILDGAVREQVAPGFFAGSSVDQLPWRIRRVPFVACTACEYCALLPPKRVDSQATYEIVRAGIRCGFCGRVSYSPGDVLHRYCGFCHLFHDTVAEGRRLHALGGTHECGEWRTGANTCALCGRGVPV